MRNKSFLFHAVDPPRVTQHPKSQSVLTGAQVTFKVEATGDDLTFQWLKDSSDVHNDSNYSGTDTNTLMIHHVKKSDGGYYSCLVRNEVTTDGEISEKAQLIVCKYPSLWWFITINCGEPDTANFWFVCPFVTLNGTTAAAAMVTQPF